MAKHTIDNLAIDIPGVSDTTALALSDVVDKAWQAQVLYTTADKVVNDLAPHLHAIFAKVESDVRSDSSYASIHGDDAKIAEKVLEIMDGYCDRELSRIKTKGWESDSLPSAAYTAMKSIKGALEYGGSLMVLTTVSQCKKYHAEQRRASRKAAADAHAAKNGAVSSEKSTGDGKDETVIGGSLRSDQQHHAAIAAVVKALDEAFALNPGLASTLAESTKKKAQNIVNTATSGLAKVS